MSKWMLLFLSVILISCGKYTLPPDPYPDFIPLVTYNVPTKYYKKYKEQFDRATAEITSRTGRRLVRFVPNDANPKYTSTGEALNKFLNNPKEAWVLFKESKDQFTGVADSSAGVAYVGSPSRPMGIIVVNLTASMKWTGWQFRQVLDHEILHNLGFDHTIDSDYSIMNYDYVYAVKGLTALDNERLATNYNFSLEIIATKDIEKIAAFSEKEESEKYAFQLMENFGLSEDRAQVISAHMLSYKKITNSRALTAHEKDFLTKDILGFGYDKGQKALEKYMQGEQDSLDDLINQAADKNGISPEHVKELFGEIFLK